jgi:hypothetical protein
MLRYSDCSDRAEAVYFFIDDALRFLASAFLAFSSETRLWSSLA